MRSLNILVYSQIGSLTTARMWMTRTTAGGLSCVPVPVIRLSVSHRCTNKYSQILNWISLWDWNWSSMSLMSKLRDWIRCMMSLMSKVRVCDCQWQVGIVNKMLRNWTRSFRRIVMRSLFFLSFPFISIGAWVRVVEKMMLWSRMIRGMRSGNNRGFELYYESMTFSMTRCRS